MRGKLKTLIVGLISGLLALIIGMVVIPKYKGFTQEIVKVPMPAGNLQVGQQITKDNVNTLFTTAEVPRFNMPAGLITGTKELVNKYLTKEVLANRYMFKDEFGDVKPKTSIKYKIKYGMVTFKTDPAKCDGGIPKEGDYVRIYLLQKSEKDAKSILHKELSQVQVLDVLNQNLASISSIPASGASNGAFSSMNKDTMPAYLVVNTVTAPQEQLLVQGTYDSEMHVALINPDNIQKDFDDILIKNASAGIVSKPAENAEQKQAAQTQQSMSPQNTNQNNSPKQQVIAPQATNNGSGGLDLE